MEAKEIKVTNTTPGYNHTKYSGECGPDVTVSDIKEQYYHPHFGGRDARVGNGTWSAIMHND